MFLLSALVVLSLMPQKVDAKNGNRASNNTRTSVNRNTNRNRNTNVNRNRNVNRNTNVNVNKNVNVDIDVDRRHGGYHPVATGIAVGVTAAVIGSITRSLPTGCSTVIVNNISYSQCGTVWCQPQYSGSSVTYIVVAQP